MDTSNLGHITRVQELQDDELDAVFRRPRCERDNRDLDRLIDTRAPADGGETRHRPGLKSTRRRAI
jgi:hypothetical protein